MLCGMHASHNAVDNDQDPALLLSAFIAMGSKLGFSVHTVSFAVCVCGMTCIVADVGTGSCC
jgi:hypothetical protein